MTKKRFNNTGTWSISNQDKIDHSNDWKIIREQYLACRQQMKSKTVHTKMFGRKRTQSHLVSAFIVYIEFVTMYLKHFISYGNFIILCIFWIVLTLYDTVFNFVWFSIKVVKNQCSVPKPKIFSLNYQ
jgi:hypothetical protein